MGSCASLNFFVNSPQWRTRFDLAPPRPRRDELLRCESCPAIRLAVSSNGNSCHLISGKRAFSLLVRVAASSTRCVVRGRLLVLFSRTTSAVCRQDTLFPCSIQTGVCPITTILMSRVWRRVALESLDGTGAATGLFRSVVMSWTGRRRQWCCLFQSLSPPRSVAPNWVTERGDSRCYLFFRAIIFEVLVFGCS